MVELGFGVEELLKLADVSNHIILQVGHVCLVGIDPVVRDHFGKLASIVQRVCVNQKLFLLGARQRDAPDLLLATVLGIRQPADRIQVVWVDHGGLDVAVVVLGREAHPAGFEPDVRLGGVRQLDHYRLAELKLLQDRGGSGCRSARDDQRVHPDSARSVRAAAARGVSPRHMIADGLALSRGELG